MLPLAAALASSQKTRTFAESTSSRLQRTGRSRRRVAAYCSSWRRVRRGHEGGEVPGGGAEKKPIFFCGGGQRRRGAGVGAPRGPAPFPRFRGPPAAAPA